MAKNRDYLSVKVTGATKAIQAIEKAVNRGNEQMKEAVLQSVLIVEADAKEYVPVDTGRLRASITHEIKEMHDSVLGKIGTNVQYGPFIEFGTTKMPRRPYLYPALSKNFTIIQAKILNALKTMVK